MQHLVRIQQQPQREYLAWVQQSPLVPMSRMTKERFACLHLASLMVLIAKSHD